MHGSMTKRQFGGLTYSTSQMEQFYSGSHIPHCRSRLLIPKWITCHCRPRNLRHAANLQHARASQLQQASCNVIFLYCSFLLWGLIMFLLNVHASFMSCTRGANEPPNLFGMAELSDSPYRVVTSHPTGTNQPHLDRPSFSSPTLRGSKNNNFQKKWT